MTGFGAIFRGVWGHYYQSPTYDELRLDYASSHNTRSQQATHYVLGIEWPLSPHITTKVESYHKQYTDLISFENYAGQRYETGSNGYWQLEKDPKNSGRMPYMEDRFATRSAIPNKDSDD